jgi:hypothetical protein
VFGFAQTTPGTPLEYIETMGKYRLPLIVALSLIGFTAAFRSATPEPSAPASRQAKAAPEKGAFEGALRVVPESAPTRRRGTWM